MISSISNVLHAQPQPATQPTRQSVTQPKPQPAVTDTVQLSGGKAIQQETLETSVQTAQEARGGDVQAMRLLARQAAAKPTGK
jgi:hypothetical protein